MSLTFAIPDIHGRLDLLEEALREIAARAGSGTVVFLGDYVDRGPQSRGVIERMIAGPDDGWRWICLSGNHEFLMRYARDNNDLDHWLKNGGGETLASYGHLTGRPVDFGMVPAAHWQWLVSLGAYQQDRFRFYVHAGVDHEAPLERQTVRTLLSKRPADDERRGYLGLHLVHGHHTAAAIRNGDRTALDIYRSEKSRLVVGVFDDGKAGGPIELIDVCAAGAQPARLAS